MFQGKGGECLSIQDLYEGFQERLIELQVGGEGLIPDRLDIGKDMGFQRSLRRRSTIEVLNRLMDTFAIKSNCYDTQNNYIL